MSYILGLDVGGSAIKYALMDKEANFIEKGTIPTPLDTKEHFIEAIVSIYNKYEDKLEGLALSMPGNINSDTGHIDTPGALEFNYNTNIFDSIHEKIPNIKISVQNDGKCAALAELWMGNLKDVKNGAVLVLESGIGGGLIANRELLTGSHFFAGELSYLIENPESVGFENVFAMHGGTGALCMRTAALKGLKAEDVDGKQVFEWIKQQDKDALEAFDHMTTHLATQIFNIQCFIDPEIVCIGGGVSKQPLVVEKINEKLNKIYEKMPFPTPRVKVTTCKYNNDSNLIGALYNYIQHDKGE